MRLKNWWKPLGIEMRKPLFKIYTPKTDKNIYWIARFNLVILKQAAFIEFTFGLLGYGILANWCYRPDPVVAFNKRRAVEDAAEETP